MKDIEGIGLVLQVLKPHWKQIEDEFDKHNQRFLALAAVDHDAIGRVLRSHLVIESFMNSFLLQHFGLEDFDGLKLSFYQKAKLLPLRGSSASAVRPGILQVNAVRNKYGHRLEHKIERHEISAVLEILATARSGASFSSEVEAIEAFARVACAFLSVPPPQLQQLFLEAFENVQSYEPENVASAEG